MKRVIVCLLCVCAGVSVLKAQDKREKIPYRFGRVSPEDFKPTHYAVDSSADAVILADVGEAGFNGGSGQLEIINHRYTRIHVLHKAGYDAADFSVYLWSGYTTSQDDRITDFKAVTYNLENGKVVETKLDSKSIFVNKLSKDISEKKWTMPNVKEGSIIEVSYTTHSFNESNLPSYSFQGGYPRVWTEYDVSIPEWFNFVFLRQGYYPVKETKSMRRENFSFRYEPDGPAGASENVHLEANVTDYVMIGHDMPALRDEHYTTTLKNHVEKIEFQLSSFTAPGGVTKNKMSSWPSMTETLMKSDYFGASLDKNNGFLADAVTAATAGATTPEAKARGIYAYVQKNFTCNDDEELWMDATTVKTVFNNHKGNSAELNLLLIAMLKRAGLDASPIILSTRSHGRTFQLYPLLRRFNYTIVYLAIGDKEFTLDASRPQLGFGWLPLECYNGHARLLTADAPPVFFEADSLKEQTVTSVMLALDSAGNWGGTYQQMPGYHSSYEIRKKVKEKGQETYFKTAGKSFATDAIIENATFTDLDSLDIPLAERFEFKINANENADHLYLTPLLGEAWKENPFTVADRKYPVEMSLAQSEVFTMNIQLPDNYEIEEIPKSAQVKLNDNDGMFQYLVQGSGNMIQLRCIVRLNRANFEPQEYNDLRAFFDYIVKKQAEQIVLKKKA